MKRLVLLGLMVVTLALAGPPKRVDACQMESCRTSYVPGGTVKECCTLCPDTGGGCRYECGCVRSTCDATGTFCVDEQWTRNTAPSDGGWLKPRLDRLFAVLRA